MLKRNLPMIEIAPRNRQKLRKEITQERSVNPVEERVHGDTEKSNISFN